MKFYFIEKDEVERDIILEEVKKWHIPFRVVTEKESYFSEPEYTIQVDTSLELFDYITKQVQTRLDTITSLEQALDLEYNEEPQKKTKRIINKKQLKQPLSLSFMLKDLIDTISSQNGAIATKQTLPLDICVDESLDGSIIVRVQDDRILAVIPALIPGPILFPMIRQSLKEEDIDIEGVRDVAKRVIYAELTKEQKQRLKTQTKTSLTELKTKKIYETAEGKYIVM